MPQLLEPGGTRPLLMERAAAKVNLFLHVTGRRADGYHLLNSLAVFAAVGDELHVGLDEGLWLELDGPFADGLRTVQDNLVMRAARTLASQRGVPPRAFIRLVKHLPVASGVGGGSADAAATLRALARLWRVDEAGPDLAVGLGADVPVCLRSRPAVMGGIGEKLSPAPVLPPCGLLLVNPGLHVATPEVFRARTGGFSLPARLPSRWPDVAAMAADLRPLGNDLERPAIGLCPGIADVLAAMRQLPACALARMSGSGATCFGLFPTPAAAADAATAIGRPGWWAWGGGLAA